MAVGGSIHSTRHRDLRKLGGSLASVPLTGYLRGIGLRFMRSAAFLWLYRRSSSYTGFDRNGAGWAGSCRLGDHANAFASRRGVLISSNPSSAST